MCNVLLCRDAACQKAKKGKAAESFTSSWQERGDGAVIGAVALACLLEEECGLQLHDLVHACYSASQFELPTSKPVESMTSD